MAELQDIIFIMNLVLLLAGQVGLAALGWALMGYCPRCLCGPEGVDRRSFQVRAKHVRARSCVLQLCSYASLGVHVRLQVQNRRSQMQFKVCPTSSA